MRLPFFLIFLLLLAWNASALQIVEFCPDPYLPDDMDEYIVLEGDGCADGVVITDGEGGFRFPQGTILNGKTTIARNGAAFLSTHGYPPDFEWEASLDSIPDVSRSGRLNLANGQDEIQLIRNTVVLQEIEWPGDIHHREGQIHFLAGEQWDTRILLLGQSRFSEAGFDDVSGVAFVSPDCSLAIFEKAVNGAKESILVNVYEFCSMKMAGSLISAKKRGVDVTVLIEGGPVGGISPEGREVIDRLAGSGIRVFQMSTTADAHAPYRFNHAKYMVIDRSRVFICSENFKESGFPSQGTGGNRGWGVFLEDEGLAAYFTDLFEFDCSGGWIEVPDREYGLTDFPSQKTYKVEFLPAPISHAHVVPVISPDTSHLILDLLNGAQETIEIEEAYIKNTSPGEMNPFLDAAIHAARRGVSVRVLLDSYWFNIDAENDNDEMVSFINSLAASERIPLVARCADLEMNNLERIPKNRLMTHSTIS